MVDFQAYIRTAREKNATDIYLSAGRPPGIRVHGNLHFLKETPAIRREDMEALVEQLVPEGRQPPRPHEKTFLSTRGDPGPKPVRISISEGLNGPTLAARLIPEEIPSLESLGLPPILKQVVSLEQGLVLVIGCAGSGKSTTLASLVNQVNQLRCRQIFTLENPVEIRHENRRSRIRQTAWEGRAETRTRITLPGLLKRAELIVLDGLPRSEVISLGVEAAARGRLVLASLTYSGGVAEALKSIIDSHPASRRDEARSQLAGTLKLALWQHLLPRQESTGFHPVCEVLLSDPVVADLIRRPGRLHLLRPAMAAGRPYGMQTMRQALAALREERRVREHFIEEFEDTIYSYFVLPVQSSF